MSAPHETQFSPGTEFNRMAVALLKQRFLAWRNPPVELPADSVIEEVVYEIAHGAALLHEVRP